jgi:ATP-dependent exoDNAse (exonuclease V) beta subunit
MTSELLEFKGRKIRKIEELKLKSSNLEQLEGLLKIEYQTIEVPVRENKPRRASKETVSIDKEKAKDGIRLHLYFEQVDFVSKDTSFIEDSRLRKLLDNALKLDIFKDIKDAKVYTEFSYIDSKNSINGIIDLLVVHKDHIDIIDYKTKNIDDSSYDKQLIIYEDYIKQKFNLPINKYLLSIVDCKVRKVA